MREIIFRGKKVNDNTFVEGYFVYEPSLNKYQIYEIYTYSNGKCSTLLPQWVDERTIDQYTGLKDKNGMRIFEHDVVVVRGHKYIVEWTDGLTGFYPFNDYDSDCGIYFDADECEIIGNVHDNPELLKGD